MNDLKTIEGIKCYIDENDIIQLNLESIAKGLDIIKIDRKNNTEYKRINKQLLQKWLFSFGILNSEKDRLPEYISEPIFYLLSMKAENEVAKNFQHKVAYEILPSIRKTGTYALQQSQPKVPFTEVVQSIDIVANSLKVNDASKLLMYDKLYSSYGVSTEFLPKYESNGSREIRPATELLKRINSNIKTVTFNQLLIKNGYLEERTRKSTKSDELRYFKALTEKGLQYGENLINQKNQREVQPYYYSDTFQELYDLVTAKETILA